MFEEAGSIFVRVFTPSQVPYQQKNGRQISSVKSIPRVIVVFLNSHAYVDSARKRKGKSKMVNLPKLPLNSSPTTNFNLAGSDFFDCKR